MKAGARGSHAPALTTLARRAITEHALAARDETVLVACSGGPDSSALLHVLGLLREELGFRLVAHAIDHGLRAEAAAELELARSLAGRLEVPFAVTQLSVVEGGNLQARARAARREALVSAAAASGATRIATGHTADDRAETLLMRLVRGTGPAGLAVLPASAGVFVRPLLRARRSDVLAHLERHRIAFASDPSNANPRFLRARVRRDLVPLLEELSPKAVDALCALADASLGLESPALPGWNRAQIEELERAAVAGRSDARIWLSGGVEAIVRFVRAGEADGGQDRRSPKPKSVKKR